MYSDHDFEKRIRELEDENFLLRKSIAQLSSQPQPKKSDNTQTVSGLDLDARHIDYRALLDNSPILIGYWDEDQLNRYANQTYESWFGIGTDQITGRHVRDLLGAEYYQTIVANIEAVLRGEPQEFEHVIQNAAANEARYAKVQYIPHQIEQRVVGFFALVTDITSFKNSQEKLVENRNKLKLSEALYRSVVQDQTEIITRFAVDGTLLFVNDAYCRFFGQSKEEIIGTRWQPVACSDDVPVIMAQLNSLNEDIPVVVIENRVYSGNGELRWMQFVNRAFFNEQGQVKEIQAVGRDITERKKLEGELSKSKERLQLVLDGSGDALWDWDLETGLVYLSPGYYVLTGYHPDEVTADIGFLKRTIHADDVAHVLKAMEQHLQGAAGASLFDYRLLSKSGAVKWVTARARIVERDATGAPTRMAGTVSDISHLKVFEELLKQERAELETRVTERTEQLRKLARKVTLDEERDHKSIARHLHDDIGQILHVIKLKLDELAKRQPAQPDILSELNALVAEASQRLRSITSELYLPLLDDLGLLPALRWLCNESEKNYDLDIEIHVLDLPYQFDEPQKYILFHAVRELLLNVSKHAKASFVNVDINYADHCFCLSVEDNGIGIEINNSGTRNSGSGLGLYNIRERINFIGGSFSIEPRAGGGTRAVITLPVALNTQSRFESGN